MDLAGKVNRTLAVNRIPACRIGRTVKLGVKADLPHCILNRMANQPSCRLPCRPAGCAANDCDLDKCPILYCHLEFRGAEMLTIIAKANLPWKATSGGRGNQAFAGNFFSRGNNRNVFLGTKDSEIHRKIIVPQEIQYQIAGDIFGKIGAGVIQNRGQYLINIKDLKLEKFGTILAQAGNFLFATAILLKNHESLPGVQSIIFH